MPSPRLRLAVQGLGSAGMRHADAAMACAQVELVGVADSLEAPRRAAQKFGVDVVDNLEDLLALRPDAVVIALPHALLAEAAHRVLDASAHVLIEKPLALDGASGRDVADHAERRKLGLMVNFNHRFRPEYVRASQLVGERSIGDITFLSAHMSSGYGPLPNWVWDPKIAGGGMMTYNGIHTLDHLIWLAGSRPTHVAAMSENRHFGRPLEDTLVGTLRFESGALAVVSQVKTKASRTLGIWETTIIGRQGTITVSTDRTVTCVSDTKDQKDRLPEENRFANALDHFATSILSGSAPIPGAADALLALDTLTALYRSAETGAVESVAAKR